MVIQSEAYAVHHLELHDLVRVSNRAHLPSRNDTYAILDLWCASVLPGRAGTWRVRDIVLRAERTARATRAGEPVSPEQFHAFCGHASSYLIRRLFPKARSCEPLTEDLHFPVIVYTASPIQSR